MRKVFIDKKIEETKGLKYNSLIELLDIYNISIYHRTNMELGNEYSVSINNSIFIRDNLEPTQEKFVLLHELGHILLHDSKANFFSPRCYKLREEQEANYFALRMIEQFQSPELENVSNLGIPVDVLIKLRDGGMI